MGRPAPGEPQVPRRAGGRRRSASGSARPSPTTCPTTSSPTSILTASAARTSTTRPPATSRCCATPDAVMENTTQLFLAVRFNCNKCHDHPFERWTQDQYYQLALVLRPGRPDARTRATRARRVGGTDVEGAKPLVEIIADVQERRDQARPHRRGGAAGVPLPAQGPGPADGHAAASSWRTGSPRRRTSTSPRAMSIACGPTCSASA